MPLGAGWLSSGSCTVAACYEDCDPCFQACKCTRVCENPVAGEQGLRIVAHEPRVLERTGGRFVRVLDVVVGPALAPLHADEGPEAAEPARLAEFARSVLDVNADLFTAVAAPLWRLEAVESFPDRTAVLFALEPGHFEARRANTVSLYFDAHGRLLEAAHVVELRPD